jgi:hypothetical protein
MATVGSVTHWKVGPIEFQRAGIVWELTVWDFGLCGIRLNHVAFVTPLTVSRA